MSFPASPSNNQVATVNNIVYTYNSANNAWTRTAVSSVAISNTSTSTSTTTGALTVAGGVGIAGNLTVGGTLVIPTVGATTVIATTVNAATIGNISANHVGTGTYLTSLNASNLSTGTVPLAQLSGITTSQLSGTAGITNGQLANSSVTVTAGTGMSGGGAVALGSTITLTNAGVTGLSSSGTGNLTVSAATGAVTVALPATGPAAGSYGSGASIPVITLDGYGRVSGISAAGLTAITNLSSSGAGNVTVSAATGSSTISLPATGPGAVATGSSTAIPVITTDAYGRVSLATTAAVVAPAGTLTGATLAAGVTASSLTSVGTIATGTWSAGFGAVSGANLTSLTAGNLTGTIPSGVLGNSTHYVGTTAIALNRASASQTLTGISIDGSAATATTATNQSGGTVSATTGAYSGLVQITNNTVLNTTTPGTANYGLHFTGQLTADYAAGLTWNGGTGTTGAQAGIYVQGSGNYGTKMYIATTDSYATGSKTAISIDHLGVVNVTRAALQRNSRNVVTNFTGTSAPATPLQGDEWYNSSTGVLYKYVYDGATNNWINISSALTNSSTSATANTLALRDSGGSLTATTFIGKATSAQYADLAEMYVSDQDYAAGTVVIFGGEEEITTTDISHDTRVAGVISTNPAYLMNSEAAGLPVAFTGRVPCMVQGPVRKGDVLVTSLIPGVACKLDNALHQPGCVIGKSLGNIITNEIATIEVVVGRF